ncbi:MAG: 3-oxoacyl-[acyl-carrier-protein] synthase [Chloroflexia bacterium]|nr:3-oxoacyl-[acyl-carrier-protein] synthase [Chloroflexia bacterium]
MQNKRRVVITGLGAVTPVGNTAEETWRNLLAGKSGIGQITLFDPADFAIKIAGEVKNFDPGEDIDAKEVRHMDRSVQFAVVASKHALRDAGMEIPEEDSDRVGIIFGTGAGGVGTLLAQQEALEERGPRRVSPHFLPNFLPDSASGQVAIAVGARGPNMAVVSACATGGHAVGESMETILRGDADVMLAGGTEAVIVPVVVAGFINMRALGDDPDPTKASKPFDARRSGFVLSEGAAVLVLEEYEHARKRGAKIYAEVVGYGSTNDAYHMAAQLESGAGAARTMERALRKAGMQPEDVDYINAHGTGTPLNDRVETLAIKNVFGPAAYKLAVSSTKSMTGHMMGAAGAVESLVCALAIRDNCLPPTINLEQPDPECDLDYVPLTARPAKVDVAMSNSIGLGGHNSCVILKRVEDA